MTTYDPDVEELLGPASAPLASAEPPPVPNAQTGGAVVTAHYGSAAFDGAGHRDKALALWAPPLKSADDDLLPEKPVLDARVRDMLRNDAYVAAGATLHKDNIVGSLFMLNAKPMTKVLGLDDTWETEFQEEVEAKFTLWAESPSNWVDAARRKSLTEMVRLAVGVYVAGGEVLGSVEWLRDGPRVFNTAIQMIDLDRLSTPFDQLYNTMIRAGVEMNQYGAPQAFHVRMTHPSDWQDPNYFAWKRVPIRKPWGRLQMIYVAEQTRPEQTRGVSEMVAALKECRTTKRFRDIVLQNAVLNATYAASIESELPTEQVFAQLGGGNIDKIGEYITGYATQYLGAIDEYVRNSRNIQLDGVKIPHLFPGTKLQLRPAGDGGPLGTDFEQSLLRYIAAILGVSYEELSRDYTKTNYSSARAAQVNTWRFMQARKRFVADRFASAIYRLWLEEAINKKLIASMPRNAPGFYDGLNADAYSACDWIGASRGQIDELKETQAAVLRIKSGLATSEDELARLGKDWRTVYRQLAREQAFREKIGLNFTPDAATTALAGNPGSSQGAGANA